MAMTGITKAGSSRRTERNIYLLGGFETDTNIPSAEVRWRRASLGSEPRLDGKRNSRAILRFLRLGAKCQVTAIEKTGRLH
jgi:hypothetical protein